MHPLRNCLQVEMVTVHNDVCRNTVVEKILNTAVRMFHKERLTGSQPFHATGCSRTEGSAHIALTQRAPVSNETSLRSHLCQRPKYQVLELLRSIGG